MVQVGQIPDKVLEDNLLFLDNIDHEWILWMPKSYIPENVKLCESPGKAGGLPKC